MGCFLDRYFPYTPPAAQPVATAKQDTNSVAGTYWFSRRSQDNIIAVIDALAQDKVSVNSDGTLSVDRLKDFAGNPKHFEEIAPLMFREVHGQSRLAFIKDYAGRQIIVIDWPFFVAQPVPLLKDQVLDQRCRRARSRRHRHRVRRGPNSARRETCRRNAGHAFRT